MLTFPAIQGSASFRNGSLPGRTALLATSCFHQDPVPTSQEGTSSPFGSGAALKLRKDFAVYGEMLTGADILAKFDVLRAQGIADSLARTNRLAIIGEGSSMLAPGAYTRDFVDRILRGTINVNSYSAGDSEDRCLDGRTILLFSNSGKTREVVQLRDRLLQAGHQEVFVITANGGTPLTESISAERVIVLDCGPENAVAATKSVIEQMLFGMGACALAAGQNELFRDPSFLQASAERIRQLITAQPHIEAIRKLVVAPNIYVAGADDGIPNEVALKIPELTGKRGIAFPGSLLIHGPLEARKPEDVILVINPTGEFLRLLHTKVKDDPNVIVIGEESKIAAAHAAATKIVTLDCAIFRGLLGLAACWNLFLDTGLALRRNLDKPNHLTKVATLMGSLPG